MSDVVYRVDYTLPGFMWERLTDKYETFERAATVAAALENRGYKTRIIEQPK
jgi:hypothetical protein